MKIDWRKKHILKIGNEIPDCENPDDKTKELRNKIEPWLTALFQSEHLSLLIGSGVTTAVSYVAEVTAQGMNRIEFENYKDEIKSAADRQAEEQNRGEANLEDDFRVAIELYNGLSIIDPENAEKLKTEIGEKLSDFIRNVLQTEKNLYEKFQSNKTVLNILKSFLISFASRTATKDRLHIFTTNYDRLIEMACDESGILVLDRFIGKIQPIFRSGLELDYHYNPPGIRGEPRYVEGVVRFTKLHGSLDWKFENAEIVKTLLPFGAQDDHPAIPDDPFEHLVIYPNSSKAIETALYPYSELFRDFSKSICRPNSVLVVYGYGFGDSHINRIIKDMLSIPSTHLVVIAFDDASGRVQEFLENINSAQLTLLYGEHFGNLSTLVEHYMPKSAIDKITRREQKIRAERGQVNDGSKEKEEENDEQ